MIWFVCSASRKNLELYRGKPTIRTRRQEVREQNDDDDEEIVIYQMDCPESNNKNKK